MKKAATRAGSGGGAARASAIDSIAFVDQLNTLHREIQAHETQVLLKARAVGELLLEVKKALKHGEYLMWLAENFEGSQATAWRYTRIAKCWDEITANYSSVNSLSISKALHCVRYGYSSTSHQDGVRA